MKVAAEAAKERVIEETVKKNVSVEEDLDLDEEENEKIESIVGKVKSTINEEAFGEDSEMKDFGGKVASIAAQVEKNPLKKNRSRDFVEKNVAKNFVEKTLT